ncbi:MAG: twin-arginine translocase subunit TatC [Chloroflexota bacterium]
MSVAELAQPRVSSPGEEEESAEKTMTIIEHLEELRFRLTVSLITVLVMMVPGWFAAVPVMSLLREPVSGLGPLHYLSVAGAFVIQLKIMAVLGVSFAFPVLLYEVWAFIAPGLTKKERKGSIPFVVLGLLLFCAGVYTGYRIIPLAVNFLLGFSSNNLQPMLVADSYFSFVAIVCLVFGITFQLPLVLVFLCSINVITSGWLLKKLRYAIIIIFIVSTIITPGADFISPLVLGAILSVLYVLAIGLAKLIGK